MQTPPSSDAEWSPTEGCFGILMDNLGNLTSYDVGDNDVDEQVKQHHILWNMLATQVAFPPPYLFNSRQGENEPQKELGF